MLQDEVRIDDPASYTGRSFKYLIAWSVHGPDEIFISKHFFRKQEVKGGRIVATSSFPVRDEEDLKKITRSIETSLLKIKGIRGRVRGNILVDAFSRFEN